MLTVVGLNVRVSVEVPFHGRLKELAPFWVRLELMKVLPVLSPGRLLAETGVEDILV